MATENLRSGDSRCVREIAGARLGRLNDSLHIADDDVDPRGEVRGYLVEDGLDDLHETLSAAYAQFHRSGGGDRDHVRDVIEERSRSAAESGTGLGGRPGPSVILRKRRRCEMPDKIRVAC